MKHSNTLLGIGVLAVSQLVSAGNTAEPYAVIARENAFRLKPPPPEEKQPVPAVNRPQITLQGFATILGRAQVLLNIQRIGATGFSCVLSENENRDGVTILEINVKTETVRLNNLGLEQRVALKR